MKLNVDHVGHTIGPSQVSPFMAKNDVITKFPPDTNTKKPYDIFRQIWFYRAYCSNVATIVQPLPYLLWNDK